jgi:hypothetical protein
MYILSLHNEQTDFLKHEFVLSILLTLFRPNVSKPKTLNPLKTKSNLLYIKTLRVPRSKHFQPRL